MLQIGGDLQSLALLLVAAALAALLTRAGLRSGRLRFYEAAEMQNSMWGRSTGPREDGLNAPAVFFLLTVAIYVVLFLVVGLALAAT